MTNDQHDELDKILAQIRGIAELASIVPTSRDEISDRAMSRAMWAVRDLLDRADRILATAAPK